MKTEDRIENFNFPERHPEDYCHECGRDNPSWFAPNDAFNRLVPSRTGIMCPTCFLLRDKTDTYWIVMPEGHETSLAGQLAEAQHEIRSLRERIEEDDIETLDSVCRFLGDGEFLSWREVLAKHDRVVIAESETAELRALVGELADDAKKTDTVLFYIGNLSHQAWTDPKNVEALFRRIEAYAKDRRKENAELLARAEEATK